GGLVALVHRPSGRPSSTTARQIPIMSGCTNGSPPVNVIRSTLTRRSRGSTLATIAASGRGSPQSPDQTEPGAPGRVRGRPGRYRPGADQVPAAGRHQPGRDTGAAHQPAASDQGSTVDSPHPAEDGSFRSRMAGVAPWTLPVRECAPDISHLERAAVR